MLEIETIPIGDIDFSLGYLIDATNGSLPVSKSCHEYDTKLLTSECSKSMKFY